ncbi:MAG: DUF1572 family protein [Taibaiella sp.]|nr:DUF1572 family protein [Taibaiella sp.]
METDFCTGFKEECLLRITESADRVSKCVQDLSEEELWHRQNEHLSPVANLVLHLCGNISQYIIMSLGHQPYTRERDTEFAAHRSHSKIDLLRKFSQTIADATSIIANTTEEELLRTRTVQGFTMTGIGAVIHVTEHLSYHTGQIAMHTKLLKNHDLGFYSGVNLNQ